MNQTTDKQQKHTRIDGGGGGLREGSREEMGRGAALEKGLSPKLPGWTWG